MFLPLDPDSDGGALGTMPAVQMTLAQLAACTPFLDDCITEALRLTAHSIGAVRKVVPDQGCVHPLCVCRVALNRGHGGCRAKAVGGRVWAC